MHLNKIPFKIIILFTYLLLIQCNSQNKEQMQNYKFTNALVNETSPYLLQHAHNPVNWHAWNKETLALAKKENKLLLISIGYSACHWCHVMEHEIFEDEESAEFMNKHFINVKVDREERPDVDQIYMNAVQLLTGRGGWPLNCVAMPDGKPIWGGTYFPKKQWLEILQQIVDLNKNSPEKLEEQAINLTKGVVHSDTFFPNKNKPNFTLDKLNQAVNKWETYMDFEKGGRNGAPKFPMPVNLEFLLRYATQTDNSKLLAYVDTTLTQMAYGGIQDQVGGGFSRYSVDNRWHIPHFEKMLYDNGQLISLYANAFKVTKNNLYKETVYATTQFLERELMFKNGAFYSSLDADSLTPEGKLEEGAFYVWTKAELQTILKEDFELFSTYYNVNSNGKWEHDNYHLIRTKSDKEIANTFGLTEENLTKKVVKWKQILLAERDKRNRPRLDDKTLTSWNALTLKGYIDAYKAFDDDHFLQIALKNAKFLKAIQISSKGSLHRNFKNGKSNITANLEDYATLIDAFISLYEVTLDESWLNTSKQLTNYCFDHYFEDNTNLFYFTSDTQTNLITRKIDTQDNVIASSNSIMAINLFKLSHYYDNKAYSKTAKNMLNNVFEDKLEYVGSAANWFNLYLNYTGNFYEIAIVGKDAKNKIRELNKTYLPNKLIAGSLTNSKMPLVLNRDIPNETNLFICVNNACKLPLKTVEEALKEIKVKL